MNTPPRKVNRVPFAEPGALLTRHHKAALIAPELAALGLTLTATDAFDTDQLGTFSGEIARTLSPLDCARTKAKLACQLTGCSWGIGSEGSFGGGPFPGMLPWNEELLLLYDQLTGQEIVARVGMAVALTSIETQDWELVRQHLAKHDPKQGWMLRGPDGWHKELQGEHAVLTALQSAGLLGPNLSLRQQITLQPDLRAHVCPPRQAVIQQAAAQLAQRLTAHCPHCSAPDFWVNDCVRGLPCGDCGFLTSQISSTIKRCSRCGHQEQQPVATAWADAKHCPSCNP
ncbi:DUF6671 family protein [Alkalimonas amylolytica]|uniref:DUF6671 domain-containing protein n=1 Tax=Alkalimonas amylolytica TaxID=152573 RepID=A0A1H4FEP1_ALKAM|nr:DUF6671 family protein [Alkalimonas amylolytica]SEA95290.1 hypothetical protein SAMN04488051_1105 [Alkalimonas amylolytica]